MLAVLEQVVPGELGVLVGVQLEEPAVEHIEVLITEVLHHSIDVRFLVHMHELVDEVGAVHLSQRQLPCARHVHLEEDARDDGEGVLALELVMRLEELQPGVEVQQLLHEGNKVVFA